MNKDIFSLICSNNNKQWSHIFTGNILDCGDIKKERKHLYKYIKVVYQFNLSKYSLV